MILRYWLRRADALGLGIISFRHDEEDGGWFCFCSTPPFPHVARGRTGIDALRNLVRHFWSELRCAA